MPILQSSVIAQNTQAKSPQDTSPAMISGVDAHQLTAAQASVLSSNGINWIRCDVSFNQSECNWISIYQLALEYNLNLIGILDPYTMNFNNSFTLSDWQQTAQTAVTDFGSKVSAWEIWNEPYLNTSWCGYYQGTAQQYVDLMRTAYQIIKAAYPYATVLGLGGMQLYSSTDGPSPGITWVQQSINFTQQVVSLGGMNYCDAISLHAYPWGDYSTNAENAYVSSIAEYRAITGKDVWITETGQESVGTGNWSTPQEQSAYLSASYPLLHSQGVKAYIWYELQDNYTFNNSTFGLYDVNGTAKPALETYFILVSALPAVVNYLVENYNSTVGLIPEVPGGNTYWLYSDNFLASLALERHDSQYPGNLTITNIAANIDGNVSKYIAGVPNVLNQYMVLNSPIAAFNTSNSYTVCNYAGAVINITLNNGTSPLNQSLYADIAFLEALYYNSAGQAKNANDSYQIGMKMYDGNGMNDPVFQNGTQKGQYQTFKLALYIYASKVLGYQFPPSAEADLLRMQGASGGFYTGYDANFSSNGTNTNVETTSLAILALLVPTPSPSEFPSPTSTPEVHIQTGECFWPLVVGSVLGGIIVFAILVFYFLRIRKRL
jgi:hypothetical protein